MLAMQVHTLSEAYALDVFDGSVTFWHVRLCCANLSPVDYYAFDMTRDAAGNAHIQEIEILIEVATLHHVCIKVVGKEVDYKIIWKAKYKYKLSKAEMK